MLPLMGELDGGVWVCVLAVGVAVGEYVCTGVVAVGAGVGLLDTGAVWISSE